MAQKASPYAIRVGYNQEWNNYSFAKNKLEEIKQLKKDKSIRNYFYSLFPDIDRLKIEYPKNKIIIYLYIPEVSLVLGEKNEKLKKTLKGLYEIIQDDKVEVKLNLIDVKRVYAHAQSIANLVKSQLSKRTRSRQVLKGLINEVSKEKEVKGIKIRVNGLVDGFDQAQKKKIIHRRMRLSRKDSNIEIGTAEVFTTRGLIGIQVITYKGEMLQKKKYNYVNAQKN